MRVHDVRSYGGKHMSQRVAIAAALHTVVNSQHVIINLLEKGLLVHRRDVLHLVYISGDNFHASDCTVLKEGLNSCEGRAVAIGNRGILDTVRRHDV